MIPSLTGMIERSTASGWLLCVLGVLAIGQLYIKQRPKIREMDDKREANLLQERADEMELMRERIATLEAGRQIDRHRINNLTQCLDALLLLIEQDPAKAAEAASRIKEMRAAQMAAEAAEKGAVAAGKVQGATA